MILQRSSHVFQAKGLLELNAISNMAAPNPTVEILVEHAASSIGEGPHWDDKDNKLLYVDILDNNVHRLDVETKEQDTATLGESCSWMVSRLSQVPLTCISEKGSIMYCDAEHLSALSRFL